MSGHPNAHLITDMGIHAAKEAMHAIRRVCETMGNDGDKALAMLTAMASVGGRAEAMASVDPEMAKMVFEIRQASNNAQMMAQAKAVQAARNMGLMD